METATDSMDEIEACLLSLALQESKLGDFAKQEIVDMDAVYAKNTHLDEASAVVLGYMSPEEEMANVYAIKTLHESDKRTAKQLNWYKRLPVNQNVHSLSTKTENVYKPYKNIRVSSVEEKKLYTETFSLTSPQTKDESISRKAYSKRKASHEEPQVVTAETEVSSDTTDSRDTLELPDQVKQVLEEIRDVSDRRMFSGLVQSITLLGEDMDITGLSINSEKPGVSKIEITTSYLSVLPDSAELYLQKQYKRHYNTQLVFFLGISHVERTRTIYIAFIHPLCFS